MMSGKWLRFAKNGLFISLQRSLTDNYLVGNHQPPLHFPPLSSNYKLYWGDWPKSADTRNPKKKTFQTLFLILLILPHYPFEGALRKIRMHKELEGWKSRSSQSFPEYPVSAVSFQTLQDSIRKHLSREIRVVFFLRCFFSQRLFSITLRATECEFLSVFFSNFYVQPTWTFKRRLLDFLRYFTCVYC